MIVGLASAVLTLFCASVPGVTTNPTGSAISQDEAAQQAFRAGVDAARQEHWVDARTAFEKAYSLSPRPVVLINLAGAQARTGRLTEAAKNYHRILEDESAPETVSFRRAAADVLPALEARIPHVRLRPSGLTPTDIIQIDGEPVEIEAVGSGHPLDPGEHTLVVKHGVIERARVLFTLAERELRYIALPLPALVLQPSPPLDGPIIESPDEAPPGPGERRSRRSWWKSPWTWTTAVVLVAGASVATFVALDHHDQPFVGNIPPGQIPVR
jgi:hypothetical protein